MDIVDTKGIPDEDILTYYASYLSCHMIHYFALKKLVDAGGSVRRAVLIRSLEESKDLVKRGSLTKYSPRAINFSIYILGRDERIITKQTFKHQFVNFKITDFGRDVLSLAEVMMKTAKQ